MKIEPLPTNVRSYLRSGVAITSVTQCVEELVLNALDAGATCVAVRVDLNCFKVQVVDNGSGIPQDQLDVVGNRFCTSKCHQLTDLNNLCHFGYRGEALASIRDSCSILEITTRSKLSSKTYCKIYQSGKSLKVSESTIARPSVGTTITVYNLFTNFPVRQKSLNKSHEIERIKEILEGIALIRSGISFTLRNDSTGQVILSTRKCSSINATFGQLFGTVKADMLVDVEESRDIFKVHGFIGREGHQRKNLQYIYVNGRLVKKSRIHKLLNKLLLNLPALKAKLRLTSEYSQVPYNKQSLFMSPPKFSEAYPVYILEVKCPVSEYDITFEPAKTMVEFKDWETLLTCVEDLAKKCLAKENAAVMAEITELNENEAAKEIEQVNNVPVISTDAMKGVLASKTVKRKNETEQGTIKEVGGLDDVESLDFGSVPNIEENAEEIDMFKTPSNKRLKINKAAIGMGNRCKKIETEINDRADVAEAIGASTLNSSSSGYSSSSSEATVGNLDVSASSDDTMTETERGKLVITENCEADAPENLVTAPKISKQKSVSPENLYHLSRNVPQCSLSRYRQSIGKFSAMPAKSVNIDYSLKKLNKIFPSTSKPNSKTLFSSLQRFRRKVEHTLEDQGIPNIYHERKPSKEIFVDLESESAFRFSRNSEVDNWSAEEDHFVNQPKSKVWTEAEEKNLTPFEEADKATLTDHKYKDKLLSSKHIDIGNKGDNEDSIKNYDSASQELGVGFRFSPCLSKSIDIETASFEKTGVGNTATVTEKVVFDNGNNEVLTTRVEKHDLMDKMNGMAYLNFCEKDSVKESGDLLVENNHESGVLDTCMNVKHPNNTSSRCDRNVQATEEDNSSGEVEFKYTARRLTPFELENELNFNCDTFSNVCNSNNCDNIDRTPGNDEFRVGNENVQAFDVDISNKVNIKNVDTCALTTGREKRDTQVSEKDLEDNNCKMDIAPQIQRNEQISKITESNIASTDKFVDSTQSFSPRLTPETNAVYAGKEETFDVETCTPESLGFTPKLQSDSPIDTRAATGSSPRKDVCKFDSLNKEISVADQETKDDSNGISSQRLEGQFNPQRVVSDKKDLSNSKTDKQENVMEDSEHCVENKTIVEEKLLINGLGSDSVTLSQMLHTPAQTVNSRKNFIEESAEEDIATETPVIERKGFTFADLFSQTPCTLETSTDALENVGTEKDFSKNAHGCVNCNEEIKETDEFEDMKESYEDLIGNSSGKCENNKTSENILVAESESVDKHVIGETDEMLWTDSPWEVPESSSVTDESNKDKKLVLEGVESNDGASNYHGKFGEIDTCCKVSNRKDLAEKKTDIDDIDMNIFDNLDAWYQRLDAGISIPSDVLQSKKPSDVIKRLHACRFSKESLKTVKVLGQLDKKFIACLINTEEQTADIDPMMLVLIDQHAAHERIRLEILTEDAFQDGIKGGKLAPFAVDPPYTMAFAEHEVRTILSFKDEYLKLGINLKPDTPTTVLISSVPASLIDKEKNSKIYWSTVQVLIREHIAMFMSTQISHSVLPQTIHKVLCSLACHGAIKFGDRLSSEESVKLIKDLSLCDLPFQCAHGRPSVMPLFHMGKLQSLSHVKTLSKPNLWKLRQAVKKKKT